MANFFLIKGKNEIYYRWGGILLLGILFPLLDHDPFTDVTLYLRSALYGTIMCAIFWNGSMYTILFTNWLFDYQKRMALSIIMMFVFVTIFVLLTGTAIMWFGEMVGYRKFFNTDRLEDYIISILITYFISTFYAATFFFTQWRYHLVKSEKLQRANLEARFETLKTQINPHFLFNSLNTLMYLVVDNPKATEYIENLSDFMRYLLQTREKEAVTLSEELSLVRKYIYIQQNRFGAKLKVNIDIPESFAHEAIPPLAIQMLVENAIKHNVVSSDNNLNIHIYIDQDGSLVVENNLKEKIDKEPSTGVGLSNIRSRYQFLTGKQIVILCENDKFIVKLPFKNNQP
ncbi:MAG TPA: histidine kinase [Bacteroidales bacterium]|nr:histidine kinase [Bacteroidales bacterium]